MKQNKNRDNQLTSEASETTKADLFDQAIEQLRLGVPIEAVLKNLPVPYQTETQLQAELASLLEVAATGVSIAKNAKLEAPRAMKRYKFAETSRAERVWAAFLPWLKMGALPAAAAAILILGAGVANARPGNTLFGLRTSLERAPLVFTTDQDKIAAIQLKITLNRIDDAKAIIDSPTSNPSQQTAALNELNSQTQVTLAAVKKAATANAIAKTDNRALLNSLDTIADTQAQLGNQVKQKDNSNAEANNAADSALAATKDSKNVVAEIKRLATAVNDQELANLHNDIVLVIGTVIIKDKSSLNVENNTFILDDKTIIKNEDGKAGTAADIKIKDKVSVIASKTSQGNLKAEKITVISSANSDSAAVPAGKPADGEVKGAATTGTTVKLNLSTAPPPDAGPVKTPDPNTAVGGSFFEAPADLTH